MKINSNLDKYNTGFTIVELLVTVVVIGILAAITLISYDGISTRANTASLQSDLAGAKKQLALYFTENNSYPTSLDANKCVLTPKPDTNYCLKTNSTNTFTYTGNEVAYNLTLKKGNTTYGISNNSSPIDTSQPTDCPSGFIPVPGSATYGTKGFCVMKYEAKDAGNNVPVSVPAGTPWVNISQTTAITNSANVAGCTGCHLISEAEWMTLAQNVLSVPSNWSSGTVGTDFIYSGHNDNVPSNSLPVTTDDNDGYNGTNNTTGSNQRRTLTLTNGEVIWDMAGNVEEWTTGQIIGNQPGNIGEVSYSLKNWNSLTIPGNFLVNPTPFFTGIVGADSWTASINGIGGVYSNSGEITLRGFRRGGYINASSGGGVLSIGLSGTPSSFGTGAGFRVAR